MAVETQTSSWKCCATCEHWSGLWRQGLAMDNNRIAGDCKGECERNPKGVNKTGTDVCARWSQWQVLSFTTKPSNRLSAEVKR